MTLPPGYQPQLARLLSVAAQLLRAGRPGDAIAPLREAARQAPGNAEILHDLGLACLETGLLGEAIPALQGAIAVNPRYADAHLRLGIALESAGAVDAALAAYRRASDVLPSLADARYRAGDLLFSLGRTEEASAAFRRAAASAPKTTPGRIAAAKALLVEDRDAEAEKILRQVLAVDSNATALDLLGNLLADSGRFAEVRDYLIRAIERAPLRAGSYYDVVRCRRIVAEDAGLIDRMRAALRLPGLEPAQRSRVHLALGKAADDLGDPEDAMRQFDAAEALRNTIVRFDLAAFEARVDRLIATFTQEVFAHPSSAQTGLPTPILILGLPRSGTTLVEQILSAHPKVRAGGELPFWNAFGRDWHKSDATIPDAASLARAAADYRRRLRTLAHGAAWVTDKMPLNYQWAGPIHLALPDAVIIHCRRTPIDTALSIHQTHFNPRISFPTGGAALVGYVRAYQRLCAHWRAVLPHDRFIEIDYEALATDPETIIRHLTELCGLEWAESCLHPERNARIVKTPSKWQARQPIHAAAVGRWRAYEPWLGALGELVEAK